MDQLTKFLASLAALAGAGSYQPLPPVGSQAGGQPVAPRVCTTGYVTDIYGRSGDVIDNLGMKCSDGTDLGTIGGAGGNPFAIRNADGFSTINVLPGNTMLNRNSYAYTLHQIAAIADDDTTIRTGNNPAPGQILTCPSGQKIVGFAGRSRQYVDSLTVLCGHRFARRPAFDQSALLKASYGIGYLKKNVLGIIRRSIGTSFIVNDQLFQGDPAPGLIKELSITYLDASGQQKTATFQEGRLIALSSLHSLDTQSAPLDERAIKNNAENPMPAYNYTKDAYTIQVRPNEIKFIRNNEPPILKGSPEFADLKNKMGTDTILDAAERGLNEPILFLQAAGFPIDMKGEDHQTALMKASAKGNAKAVKLLLSLGADPLARNQNGQTAVSLVSNEAVRKIFATYAKLQSAKHQQSLRGVAQKIISGETTVTGQEPAGQTIKEFNAAISQQPIVSQEVAKKMLFSATTNNRPDLVAAVINSKIHPDLDVKDSNDDNNTALMKAAINGYVDIADPLLKAGANANEKNKFGYTALSFAAKVGHARMVQNLIQAHADLNAVAQDGTTPLMLAIISGNGYPEIVRLLLNAGAHPNSRNSITKRTVLMEAAARNNMPVVQQLVAAGADVTLGSYDLAPDKHIFQGTVAAGEKERKERMAILSHID